MTTAKTALLAAFLLRPGVLDETAAAWSRQIPHDFPGDYSEHLRGLVSQGSAKVLDMVTPDGRAGFIVYQVEQFNPPELLVVAAFGRDRANLTAEFMPQIEALARRLGCATVRFHTMRPGLVSAGLGMGYSVSEIVMRKDVRSHG
jgi:hypothetical protein